MQGSGSGAAPGIFLSQEFWESSAGTGFHLISAETLSLLVLAPFLSDTLPDVLSVIGSVWLVGRHCWESLEADDQLGKR